MYRFDDTHGITPALVITVNKVWIMFSVNHPLAVVKFLLPCTAGIPDIARLQEKAKSKLHPHVVQPGRWDVCNKYEADPSSSAMIPNSKLPVHVTPMPDLNMS